jgi:AraC family transcriptional regulator of adaptative response/methylated-DNA-[protein]-cysteine methyltransferase
LPVSEKKGESMTALEQQAMDYQRVEKAIGFIRENVTRQPDLAAIAASVHLSEQHFQKLFSRWAGVSPKRFVQYLTKAYGKQLLDESKALLEVSFEAGLSGSGRLYELPVSCEAVTPGEYRSKGEAQEIVYGMHPSPFGEFFLASTRRGVCFLVFRRHNDMGQLIQMLRAQWPNSTLRHSAEETVVIAEKIFHAIPVPANEPLHLFIKGTNFQIKVWEALLDIPFGKVVCYEDVARHIGLPKAARAVGNAVGSNPVSYLIPCHRVIQKAGNFGNYGGGKERKMAMLGWEAARSE